MSDNVDEKVIPPEEYDVNHFTPREAIALAVEAAKVGQTYNAQQVITNLRKKYGEELVPKELDFPEPPIPLNAIPFTLTYSEESPDAGKMLSGAMDVDASDDIVLENFGTLRSWGEEWLRNLALNAPMIDADYEAHGDLIQAHKFDFSRVKDPKIAVVCGSGSSLDQYVELLPAFPGLVICGPSNAGAVAAAGRIPDVIMALDSGAATGAHLQRLPMDDLGSLLITSTSIHPSVPKMFPKNRKWFTSIVQMQRGADHPFNVFCHMLFPYIKSFMFQAGCTVNGEVLFLNLLEEMTSLKFDAIYLLGVDFAYKKHATRCKKFNYVDGRFVEDLVPLEKEDLGERLARKEMPLLKRAANGYLTDETMLAYKRSLLTAWVITKLPIYDCSDGIITEVPKVDFRTLASSGFGRRPPSYDYEEVIRRYNAYLASVGYVPGKTSGTEGREIEGELWPWS